MQKLKLFWYDWLIVIFGALLLLHRESRGFGAFTLLFMATFYITEKIAEKNIERRKKI